MLKIVLAFPNLSINSKSSHLKVKFNNYKINLVNNKNKKIIIQHNYNKNKIKLRIMKFN